MCADSNKNEILFERLKVLCQCYSTGRFHSLFPFLSEQCVFESQWVLTPNTGKDAVVDYFRKKGEVLQRTGSYPECTIVELVDHLNTTKNDDIHHDQLAMLMCQQSRGERISTLVNMQVDENGLIARIDLCMPELFRFRHYAGPF